MPIKMTKVPTPITQNLRPVQITNPDDVRQTFLQLTHRTCPHGYEIELYGESLTRLGFTQETWGYVARLGSVEEQKIMFAAHLDDVSRQVTRVKHVPHGQNTIATDCKSILGADDKAGVAILLYMLSQQTPGTYALFFGEEVGCVGSTELASTTLKGEYHACISFDRMGYDDVITHQAGTRTASDAFALALSASLNAAIDGFTYAPSTRGVWTDSKKFAGVVAECTNVSVGYHNQHGVNESQNVNWLTHLAHACSQVKWSELPIEREPEEEVYDYSYSTRGTASTYKYWDDDYSTTSASSMLSYFETKYGIESDDLPMEDLVEIIDSVSPAELESWAYMNLEKVIKFFALMAERSPAAAQHIAEQVDKEVR